MKKKIIAVLFVMAAVLAVVSCSSQKKENVQYTCPMHPQVVQDHPGKCPICGMNLVEKK